MKLIIFDPLGHVKPYSNNLFLSLSDLSSNIDLVQFDTSGMTKLKKFFYYYLSLIICLLKSGGSSKIIFNLPLFPSIDYYILRMFGRPQDILVVHNSVYGHNHKTYRQQRYEKYIRNFYHFITHSNSTTHFLGKLGCNVKEKNSNFQFSIPYITCKGEMTSDEKEFEIPQRYFLFCGNIKTYKGLDVLCDAISRSDLLNSPHFNLVVAGKFANECKQLEQRLHEFSCKISIMNKRISDKFMEQLIMQSECVLLPYRDIDNSGIYAQVKYFKKPSIASRIGVFIEENEFEDYGLLSDVGNSISLQEAVEKLWFNDSLNAKISLNCEKREVSTWDNTANELHRHLLELTSKE